MGRLRHGPLTLRVRESRPNRSPEITQRRPVAKRKCASGDIPFRNPISAESCSGGPPLTPCPSLSRPLFRHFGAYLPPALAFFSFGRTQKCTLPQETHACPRSCPEALGSSLKPRLQRLCACTPPPRKAQRLPRSRDIVLVLRKAPGSCPEALGSSLKPRLHKLCACIAPPRRAQKLPHWKDFVPLMLHREVPKGAQTHNAHSAHRSSSQCSLEKTTVLPVLIVNNNVL